MDREQGGNAGWYTLGAITGLGVVMAIALADIGRKIDAQTEVLRQLHDKPAATVPADK